MQSEKATMLPTTKTQRTMGKVAPIVVDGMVCEGRYIFYVNASA
jgi:hypothetical protein